MKLSKKYRLAAVGGIVAVVLAGYALAQGIEIPPIPTLDLQQWATDSAILASVVVFGVSVTRKWLWKSLDGAGVVFYSLGLGMAIGGALGVFTEWLPSFFSGLSHGLAAGFIASGSVDALRSIFGTRTTTTTDPEDLQAWLRSRQ